MGRATHRHPNAHTTYLIHLSTHAPAISNACPLVHTVISIIHSHPSFCSSRESKLPTPDPRFRRPRRSHSHSHSTSTPRIPLTGRSQTKQQTEANRQERKGQRRKDQCVRQLIFLLLSSACLSCLSLFLSLCVRSLLCPGCGGSTGA